jgi:4,5-DOPA dioxygenase extradiol
MTFPSVFVSHGSPMLAIEDQPARRFLKGFGGDLPRPRAILAVSAHWLTTVPVVSAATRPETIHDFGGFPEELYRIQYPAPGAPELAARVAALLGAAGLECAEHPSRGLDHGAWVPLTLMYPDADIPVAQLSIQPRLDPAWHARLGAALKPLRDEGVLILGTGAMTHNLREVFSREPDAPPVGWAADFTTWFAQAAAADDRARLVDYRAQAPSAVRAHPTDEHLLPFFVALGAATPGVAGTRVHQSFQHGTLAMDAYTFA